MLGDHSQLAGAALVLADMGLIGVAAARQWSSFGLGLLAAALIALTPAHFMYAHSAPQALAILPFVLFWLLAVAAFERGGQLLALLVGGLALGIGCYSARPAIVLMPLYLAMTIALAGWRGGHRAWATIVFAFVLSTLPALIWLAWHPDLYATYINRYGLYDASHLNPLQGAKDFLNYNNVQERISIYWDYFDPVYIFGVLPVALALFLPAGVYQLLKRRTPMDILLIAGLLTSPVAAVLANERYIVRRQLVIIPFAILIAVAGVDGLLRNRSLVWRAVAVAGLLAIPLEVILSAFSAL